MMMEMIIAMEKFMDKVKTGERGRRGENNVGRLGKGWKGVYINVVMQQLWHLVFRDNPGQLFSDLLLGHLW